MIWWYLLGNLTRKQVTKGSYLQIGLILVVLLGSFCINTSLTTNTKSESQVSSVGLFNPDSCIENELMEFSTYFGGTGDEAGSASSLHFLADIVVDSVGDIIVIGRSAFGDFPIKSAYQATNNGGIDVTISKFSLNGSLIFSTYLGGSAHDWANCVTLDSSDNIIIGGITGSADFPLVNPYQDTLLGGSEGDADCFIAKLSKNGQTLLYSTYFGGTGSDWCYSICVNNQNQIAFTGTTYSNNLPLVNPFQSTHQGSLEIFVTLLDDDGQSLIFSTYLGSPYWDTGRGVTFDSNGDLLVTGQMATASIITEGVFQSNYGGGSSDAFLAKFKTNGTLLYFSYLGGSGFDRANDLHVDSEDNIVITGYTLSGNFPTVSPYQDFLKGSQDLFITKVDNLGENIIFSSYMGGSAIEQGFALTIDSDDKILVTGETTSTDFPSYYDSNCILGSGDCLFAKFEKNGSLLFSTKLGGSTRDLGVELAFYDENSTVVVGFTTSSDFPTCYAYQDTYGGNCDLFIMKLQTLDLVIAPVLKPTTSETPTEETSFIGIYLMVVPITLLVYISQKRRKKI